MVVGSYVGDGSSERVIDLGAVPKFGVLYAASRGVYEMNWVTNELSEFVGYFSGSGTASPLKLNGSELTVYTQDTIADNGITYRFNVQDVTYVYAFWS